MAEFSPSMEDEVTMWPSSNWAEIYSLRDLKSAIFSLEYDLRLSNMSTDVEVKLSQSQTLNELGLSPHFQDEGFFPLDLEIGILSLSNERWAKLRDSLKEVWQLFEALRQMHRSAGLEAEVLRLQDALRKILPLLLDQLRAYASTIYSLHMSKLEYQWLTRSPTATFPTDLSSTRIESDFCSSIVTVQRMSPLRLFKIRWNLEPIIFPSS